MLSRAAEIGHQQSWAGKVSAGNVMVFAHHSHPINKGKSKTMPVTGLTHYNLRASRQTIDILRDFYVSVVGLQPGYRPPFKSFGYWLYAGKRDLLHLTEAQPNQSRPTGVANTFDHVAFSCTNFLEFEAHLSQLNINYTFDHVPLTGERQLFFSDPAGNGVELNFSDKES